MIHGVLCVDKPLGKSSHAMVAIARRALGTSRVGHAGTLDPMATGVLVLAVGEGLKIVRYLTLDDKRYDAVIRLGVETDTLDAEGTVTARAEVPRLERDDVVRAAKGFEGRFMQEAPVISALKRDGVPLYARARRGDAVHAPEREVFVHALEITRVEGDEITLRVECGKGFYVRSLARDLGRALGTVGHLARLRRVRSGRFGLDQCIDPALLEAAIAGSREAKLALSAAAVPIECALETAPRVRLDAAGAEHARHGRAIAIEHALGDGLDLSGATEPLLLCDERGALLALGRRAESQLHVVRGLRCEPSSLG